MKRNACRILGVGLVVVVQVSQFLSATPASAATYDWSAEPVPDRTGNVLGPAGIDVRDIAVAGDGMTIYAAPGDSVSDNVVYKSTDAGLSWAAMAVPIKADLVAVAPDNAYAAAVASENAGAVYVTTSGGAAWDSLGVPQESGSVAAAAICDVAVSAASAGVHYVAVAGRDTGGAAEMWYAGIDAASLDWKETGSLPGFDSASVVKAVAFSPNFPSDGAVVAVTANQGVSVSFQILSLASNEWNAVGGFTGYPVTVASGGGIAGLASASIAMAPDYLGSSRDRRLAFIGLTLTGDAAAVASSGVYRLKDTAREVLKTGVNIHSVSFDGNAIIAGAYDSTTVYHAAKPLTAAAIDAAFPFKEPGGENKVVVAWAGDKAVAGTSGDESAFAVSGNSGWAFNDISLIDTTTANLRDVAVSGDGRQVYLATDDGEDLSLWRRDPSWERVLSRQGTADYIVRLAPGDSGSVYLAGRGGKTIYYSEDGGETRWLAGACNIKVQDLATESAGVVYALSSGGKVSKSINAGLNWAAAQSTGLDAGSGYVIVSAGRNNILVGSSNSTVAYSVDGNVSWARIPVALHSGAGKVQVAADENFASNKIIYAASDKAGQDIKKWVIRKSTTWTDTFRGALTGGVYGLIMDGGVLYALEFDTINNQSRLWQCLWPATAGEPSLAWTSRPTTPVTDAGDASVQFKTIPQALKVSSGKLWAIKTNGISRLYSFTNILEGLRLTAPAPGFTSRANPVTGAANEIAFRWSRPVLDTEATGYGLYIAYDEGFSSLVTVVNLTEYSSSVAVVVGPGREGSARVDFMPGTTYYWRVRVTQPVYNLYSRTRSFTIEPLSAVVPGLLTPPNGGTGISRRPAFSWQPVNGVNEYRFVLADNAALVSPIVDATVEGAGYGITSELDYGGRYFWAVKPLAPVEGGWSAIANFTTEEKPVEPAPPVVIETVPPSILHLPEPPAPAPEIVYSPPLPVPAPAVPAYAWAAIVTGAALVMLVFFLIRRTFRTAGAPEGKEQKLKESQALSFAAESFLWMLTPEDGREGQRLLSGKEEQELGKTLVSRIKHMAMEETLYQKFPGEAPLFLAFWSQYGSRDETNRYLTRSFQSGAGDVIGFLRSYLPAAEGQEPASLHGGEFGRAQYDSVSKVVDPDNVYQALINRYGPELDTLVGGEPAGSPDKAMAYQFAYVHHSVKDEADEE